MRIRIHSVLLIVAVALSPLACRNLVTPVPPPTDPIETEVVILMPNGLPVEDSPVAIDNSPYVEFRDRFFWHGATSSSGRVQLTIPESGPFDIRVTPNFHPVPQYTFVGRQLDEGLNVLLYDLREFNGQILLPDALLPLRANNSELELHYRRFVLGAWREQVLEADVFAGGEVRGWVDHSVNRARLFATNDVGSLRYTWPDSVVADPDSSLNLVVPVVPFTVVPTTGGGEPPLAVARIEVISVDDTGSTDTSDATRYRVDAELRAEGIELWAEPGLVRVRVDPFTAVPILEHEFLVEITADQIVPLELGKNRLELRFVDPQANPRGFVELTLSVQFGDHYEAGPDGRLTMFLPDGTYPVRARISSQHPWRLLGTVELEGDLSREYVIE